MKQSINTFNKNVAEIVNFLAYSEETPEFINLLLERTKKLGLDRDKLLFKQNKSRIGQLDGNIKFLYRLKKKQKDKRTKLMAQKRISALRKDKDRLLKELRLWKKLQAEALKDIENNQRKNKIISKKYSYKMALRHSILLLVTTLDVFFKSYLVACLNSTNDFCSELDTKIEFKKLMDYNLNLSGRLGDFFILDGKETNMSNINTVTMLYKKYLDIDLDEREYNIKMIKKLFAIRHLIIHRNFIVDKIYISEIERAGYSTANLKVGTKVKLDKKSLNSFIKKSIELIQKIDNSVSKI